MTLPGGDDDGPTPPTPSWLPSRYEWRGSIGAGAMGWVVSVLDRELNRVVAMKIIRDELLVGVDRGSMRERFLREARVTAQLDHPAVLPLLDSGELPDGRLWYTMREVPGHQTLRDLLGRPLRGAELVAILRLLEQVAQALAHAHRRGVVHRDVKPANILVRERTAFLGDWGIARLIAGADLDPPMSGASAPGTRMGRVLGTPPYMPPEQVRGQLDQIGPWTDVYALGVILHEAVHGGFPARRPGGPLDDLLTAALTADPRERLQDAALFAARLEAWQSAEEGRRRADLALRAAAREVRRANDAEAEASRLLRWAATALDRLPHEASAESCREAWAAEERARELSRRRVVSELAAERRLRDALEADPMSARARDTLARLGMAQVSRGGDAFEVARGEELVARYGDGAQQAWLRSGGRLTLATEPVGAVAWAHPFILEHRRLRPGAGRRLGRTPLNVELPPGSWLIRLERAGFERVFYPVELRRGSTWETAPPGGDPPPITLPIVGSLAEDDRYIPAGWFRAGGDAQSLDGLAATRVWVDGFVVKRDPVTNAEFVAFLNDLVLHGRRDEAERYMPSDQPTSHDPPRPVYARDGAGCFVLGMDTVGRVWGPDMPVSLVDWYSAAAFARWKAEKTGLPWRLPHDMEWEKAARGVDGRFYPWGDWFHPSWACCSGTQSGKPARVAVDAFPEDVSLYGVRGLVGNVRDWCANRYRREAPKGGLELEPEPGFSPSEPWFCRGGSWSAAPMLSRAACRFGGGRDRRLTSLGFRLARSWP